MNKVVIVLCLFLGGCEGDQAMNYGTPVPVAAAPRPMLVAPTPQVTTSILNAPDQNGRMGSYYVTQTPYSTTVTPTVLQPIRPVTLAH